MKKLLREFRSPVAISTTLLYYYKPPQSPSKNFLSPLNCALPLRTTTLSALNLLENQITS